MSRSGPPLGRRCRRLVALGGCVLLALTGCGGGGDEDDGRLPAPSSIRSGGGDARAPQNGSAGAASGEPVARQPRWQVELPRGRVVEAAGAGDRVYAALTGRPYRIVALRAGDGTELWTYEHGDANLSQAPIEDIEPLADGLVFVAGSDVYRLDAAGAVSWKVPGLAGSKFGPESVSADARGVVIGTGHGAAEHAPDGAPRWRVDGEDGHDASTRLAGAADRHILLIGNLAIVQGGLAGHHTVTAIDRGTGQVVWHRQTTTTPRAVLAGDLVVHQQEEGVVVGVEAATGVERWRSATEDEKRDRGLRHPLWVLGDVVVAQHIGRMEGLDAATGAVLWTAPALPVGPTERHGTVVGERLVMVVAGGVAVISKDGKAVEYTLPQPGNKQSGDMLTAVDGGVVVTSRTSRTDEGPFVMSVAIEGGER